MEVWIIQDGEKSGPFQEFDVRQKIADGEWTAETSAWHEGLDGWKKLPDIPIFRREFEKPAPRTDIPVDAPDALSKGVPQPPPIPQPQVYLRRFWARWLDMMLYSGIWWLCMWAAGQDIEAAWMNPWVMFTHYIPWFIIEALLVHYTGTTLGKWLLGMRVSNLDGSRLDLGASTWRALRVMFTGVGFGWGILAIFCQTLSLFTARRLETPLWDYTGGHRVEVRPLNPSRLISVVVLYFMAMQMQTIVLFPHLLKIAAKDNPQLQQLITENPRWPLPPEQPAATK